ncbi:MAG: radical protein [Actinomycetia bacterium]|nr:radical protein [Actinomycetes bacterium]
MPARFTCFLLKIASRCNLACDYCYMYEHADQSWREQPGLMVDEVRRQVAFRIAEYTEHADLSECVVVFHGGEPLLAGARRIAETAAMIRSAVRSTTRVDFSVQTNGLLLDEAALTTLESANVAVSLSIDGPATANDRHRRTKAGRSSFDRTMQAFELLKQRPKTFTGVIAVVDPAVPAAELLKFFGEHSPPQVDFLLPDANHLNPPPGRDVDPLLYTRWLIDAFDCWFDNYAHLPVRTFDQLLRSIAGLPSSTDAFGLGDVSLLTIETDGSYHDLDVLKITADGATATGLTVADPIAAAACSQTIESHRHLLSAAGLSTACQSCPELHVCGGGAVPHRFAATDVPQPTIYCEEMLALIGHVRARLTDALARTDRRSGNEDAISLGFDLATTSAPLVRELLDAWRREAAQELRAAAGAGQHSEAVQAILAADDEAGAIAVLPAVALWTQVTLDARRGIPTRTLSGSVIEPDPTYLEHLPEITGGHRGAKWVVHQPDPWLRAPFGPPIVFEHESEVIEAGRALVDRARQLIADYSPALDEEMSLLSHDVQLIRDQEAHPDKCVSFSDDVVPGALYVSVRGAGGLISTVDLADSLIHEHRHQKLYLLQRSHRLVERDDLRVHSPWREDPRPPSGLLHAVFVFVELRTFWEFLREHALVDRSRATAELAITDQRLRTAWSTLEEVPLTPAGRRIVRQLTAR